MTSVKEKIGQNVQWCLNRAASVKMFSQYGGELYVTNKFTASIVQ